MNSPISVSSKIRQYYNESDWWEKADNHYELDDYIKAIMPNSSDDKIDDIKEALHVWTGNSYQSIKEAEQENLDNKYSEYSKNINAFIDASPKWNGGATYRGVVDDKEMIKYLKNAWEKKEKIEMHGTSSWSKSKTKSAMHSHILTKRLEAIRKGLLSLYAKASNMARI